jgi:hypothetical protein
VDRCGAHPGNGFVDFPGRFDGADGIVFMGLGQPEQTQDFIPQDALDMTIVGRNNPDAGLRNGGHYRLNVFRVILFHQPRISGQIRKQNGQVATLALRYDPAGIGLGISIRLPRRLRGGLIQCRPAVAAKFAARRIGSPASITDLSNRMTALSAKFCVNRYLGPTVGAFHN